jgi:hypothetical protein
MENTLLSDTRDAITEFKAMSLRTRITAGHSSDLINHIIISILPKKIIKLHLLQYRIGTCFPNRDPLTADILQNYIN